MAKTNPTTEPLRRVNPTIAANIRAELGYRNLSQSDLANYLGVNEMWLSRRMNSHNQFGAEDLSEIAEYLDVHPGDLFRERHPANVAHLPARRSNLREQDYSVGALAPVTDISSARKTA